MAVFCVWYLVFRVWLFALVWYLVFRVWLFALGFDTKHQTLNTKHQTPQITSPHSISAPTAGSLPPSAARRAWGLPGPSAPACPSSARSTHRVPLRVGLCRK